MVQIVANSDKMKRIDKEIKDLLTDKNKKNESRKEIENTLKKLENQIIHLEKDSKEAKSNKDISKVSDNNKKAKRCKYFNVCYCKYKEKCKFTHTKEIYNAYLDGECDGKGLSCQDRHHKACKCFASETGCKREDACKFSHDTRVCGDWKNFANKTFKCVGCKCEW